MAELDSILDTETPDSDEASAANDYEVDFLSSDSDQDAPDTSDNESAPSTGSGHSNETETTQTVSESDRFDLSRTPLEEVPEQFRPYATQAQEQHKALQRQFTNVSEQLSDLQRQQETSQAQVAQERQQYLNALSNQNQPVSGTDDEFSQIAQSLGDDSNAVPVVRRIAELQTQDLRQNVGSLQQSVDTLLNYVSGLHQQQQSQATDNINEEIAQARESYPSADMSVYTEGISALRKTANPSTGKAYTVAEAYARLSGDAAIESAKLQGKQKSAKKSAQSKVQAKSVGGAIPTGSGALTREEAIEAWPEGFE